MADITLEQDQSLPGATRTLYKDMGDGTHALAVYSRAEETNVAWRYLGGQVITPGGVSVAATLPAGTTIVRLAPEGEDMYYRINGAPANTLSAGFVADNVISDVGPLDNLNSLSVYMAGVNIIHLEYFRMA